MSLLKDPLRKVAEKNVMSEGKLLMDAKSICSRCEIVEPPALSLFRLRKDGCGLPLQHSALQSWIIQLYRNWKQVLWIPKQHILICLSLGLQKKKIYDICKEKVKSSSKSRETYGLFNSPGFWRIRFWRALPGSLGGWEAWMHHAGCRESPFPRWGSDPHQDRTDAGQPSFRMGTMSCEVLFQSLFFWRKAQRDWYLPGLQVAWDDILPFKWQVPHPFFHW